MPRLRFQVSMSLDGFVAGPSQSAENPLGVGGMRLHEWVFRLKVWRAMHGLDGGADNESSRIVEESFANIGSTIMGRNMFGGHPGPWNAQEPWNGWWGSNPPYHHPVFVITHHPRTPLELEGGTTFHFVTGGIDEALERARAAAAGKDVSLAGGAGAAQQYLARGLVDAMELHLSPVLLGSGERLFDGLGDDLRGLSLVRTIAAPNVTHLKFERRVGEAAERADGRPVHRLRGVRKRSAFPRDDFLGPRAVWARIDQRSHRHGSVYDDAQRRSASRFVIWIVMREFRKHRGRDASLSSDEPRTGAASPFGSHAYSFETALGSSMPLAAYVRAVAGARSAAMNRSAASCADDVGPRGVSTLAEREERSRCHSDALEPAARRERKDHPAGGLLKSRAWRRNC